MCFFLVFEQDVYLIFFSLKKKKSSWSFHYSYSLWSSIICSHLCFNLYQCIVNLILQNHPKSFHLCLVFNHFGGFCPFVICLFRISYYPFAMFQFHATLQLWLFSSPFSFCHYLLSFICFCSIFSFSSYTIPKLHGHFHHCKSFCYLFHLLCSWYEFCCHFSYHTYNLEFLWNYT